MNGYETTYENADSVREVVNDLNNNKQSRWPVAENKQVNPETHGSLWWDW